MGKISYLYGKLFQKVLQGRRVKGSEVDTSSKVNSGCDVVGSHIGRFSYLGYNCTVVNADIGSFTSIASHVIIGGAEHPTNWVSMSPVFQDVRNSGPSMRFAHHHIKATPRTIIGSDVWIGNRAIVKAGVTIGVGAVIGAGAVVTKNVPPYAIVGGVPAEILKYRFSDEMIAKLLKTEWWTADDSAIEQFAKYMNDAEAFVNIWFCE